MTPQPVALRLGVLQDQDRLAFLAALGRGDGELARSLLTVHISGVETWLREAI